MGKRTRKSQKSQTKVQELVVVATTETMEEAKEYETLLKNNDIPAFAKQQTGEVSQDRKFVVMVPEDMSDEAHVIIESQDAYDDFYDFALDETDEDDFEGEIFEEEL